MDLEVEVAADGAGIARVPHRPDPLAGPDPRLPAHPRQPAQVGIEVAALLASAVDQEEVAVEEWIEAPLQNPAAAYCEESRPAGGDDVEPFVGATAAAGRAELADRAPRPVGTENRKDVIAVGDAARPRRLGAGR